jgi:hypothetical protein
MSGIDGSSFREGEPLLQLYMPVEVKQGDPSRPYDMSTESYGVA